MTGGTGMELQTERAVTEAPKVDRLFDIVEERCLNFVMVLLEAAASRTKVSSVYFFGGRSDRWISRSHESPVLQRKFDNGSIATAYLELKRKPGGEVEMTVTKLHISVLPYKESDIAVGQYVVDKAVFDALGIQNSVCI